MNKLTHNIIAYKKITILIFLVTWTYKKLSQNVQAVTLQSELKWTK